MGEGGGWIGWEKEEVDRMGEGGGDRMGEGGG